MFAVLNCTFAIKLLGRIPFSWCIRFRSVLLQVIESLCTNGKALEPESKAPVQNFTPPELRDVPDNCDTEWIPLKSSESTGPTVNYEDTLEVIHHGHFNLQNYFWGFRGVSMLHILVHWCTNCMIFFFAGIRGAVIWWRGDEDCRDETSSHWDLHQPAQSGGPQQRQEGYWALFYPGWRCFKTKL